MIAVFAAFPEAEKLLQKQPNKAELLAASQNYPFEEIKPFISNVLPKKEIRRLFDQIL